MKKKIMLIVTGILLVVILAVTIALVTKKPVNKPIGSDIAIEKVIESQEESTQLNQQDNTAKDNNNPEEGVIVISGTGEKIITVSGLTYKEPDYVPSFYSLVNIENNENNIYAYTDKNGTIQLRAYGSCWEMTNNVKQEEYTGYYPASLIEINGETKIIVMTSTSPIKDTIEDAANVTISDNVPTELPIQYKATKFNNVYTAYTNNNTQIYRTYGTINGLDAFYPSQSDGSIDSGSIQVNLPVESTALLSDVPVQTNQGNINVYPAIINGILCQITNTALKYQPYN